MVPERKTVFKAHRTMISEELGKGCEAASIKNVHSILPSKFIIHDQGLGLLYLSLLLWEKGIPFWVLYCIMPLSDTWKYIPYHVSCFPMLGHQEKTQIEIDVQEVAGEGSGKTTNRGVREAELSQEAEGRRQKLDQGWSGSGALRRSLESFGVGMALHNCPELRQGGWAYVFHSLPSLARNWMWAVPRDGCYVGKAAS